MDILAVLQVLIALLLIALFIAGVIGIVGAIKVLGVPARCGNSPEQIAHRTSAELQQVTAEGERAMDEVSEQYLNTLYDRVTGVTGQEISEEVARK